jgi:hypothetical protein
MKISAFLTIRMVTVAASALALALATRAQAEPSPATPPGTNVVASEAPVPLAVFDLTNGAPKDPFFPLSTRLSNLLVTNAAPVSFTVSSFVLKGLSGPPTQRLALINNRTVAAGEEAEVTTDAGKVKIRCVQVKEDSAIIQVANQSETLELRFNDHSRY